MENLRKFGFEFLSIFIGIFAAFALDNWNEERKEKYVERKILTEIKNGLEQDLTDLKLNKKGHQFGIVANDYFKEIVMKKRISNDSTKIYYIRLFRDFISIQNVSGYQSLKSKGLELIETDSLRSEIISLYENDYSVLKKLEEDYAETQFHTSFFNEVNSILASNFLLDKNGIIIGLKPQMNLTEKEKNILLIDFFKIKDNRLFILRIYNDIEAKVLKLQKNIEKELQSDI